MASYQRPSSAAGLVGQSKPPQVNGWEVEGSKTAVRSHSAMRQQVSFSPYVQAYSQAQMDAAQQQAAAAQRPQSAMTYRASKSKKWKRHYGPQFEYTLEYEEDTQGKKQKAKVQQTFNRKTQSWTEYKDTPARVTTPSSGGQFLHGAEQKAESVTETESKAASEVTTSEAPA